MDRRQVEALTRSFAAAGSRRAALLTLVTGSLGLLGVTDVLAKKKRKGKGKGKGKKKCGKGKRLCGTGCIATTSCCPSELSGENECDPCARQTCVNGVCQCDPSLINHNGVCGVFVNCQSVGELCTSDFDCCSDQCMPVGNGQARCIPGTQNCLTDFDCVSGNCRGFLCPELYQSLTGGAC